MKIRIPKRSAFSLVEVALALGIMAFGLTGIVALIPVGLNSNRSSIQQTEAANIVTGIAADLREIPSSAQIASSGQNAVSSKYGIDVSQPETKGFVDAGGMATTSGGNAASSLAASSLSSSSRYQVNVAVNHSASAGRMATTANIQITWPAQATSTNIAGSLNVFVALDRN